MFFTKYLYFCFYIIIGIVAFIGFVKYILLNNTVIMLHKTMDCCILIINTVFCCLLLLWFLSLASNTKNFTVTQFTSINRIYIVGQFILQVILGFIFLAVSLEFKYNLQSSRFYHWIFIHMLILPVYILDVIYNTKLRKHNTQIISKHQIKLMRREVIVNNSILAQIFSILLVVLYTIMGILFFLWKMDCQFQDITSVSGQLNKLIWIIEKVKINRIEIVEHYFLNAIASILLSTLQN